MTGFYFPAFTLPCVGLWWRTNCGGRGNAGKLACRAFAGWKSGARLTRRARFHASDAKHSREWPQIGLRPCCFRPPRSAKSRFWGGDWRDKPGDGESIRQNARRLRGSRVAVASAPKWANGA